MIADIVIKATGGYPRFYQCAAVVQAYFEASHSGAFCYYREQTLSKDCDK